MLQSFWLFGTQLTILADEKMTGSHYDLIDGVIQPGVETPLHLHTKYSEVVYVVEGEITVHTNDGVHVLSPGQSFIIPKNTPHLVAASGFVPARALAVASPSGFARLIRTVGSTDPSNPSDVPDPATMDLFMRMSDEIGDVLLGPPGSRPAAK